MRVGGTEPVTPDQASDHGLNACTLGGDSDVTIDATLLKQARAAVAAVAVAQNEPQTRPEMKDLASRTRVDSAKDRIPQLPPKQRPSRSPLRVQTITEDNRAPLVEDLMATSPTLRKHVIPPVGDNANTLSPLQPTSPTQEAKEKLPSFRQLTELAEAAATQESRPAASHHHSHSFGSTTSQSPRMPYFVNSVQTSPISYYRQNARSPTSTIGEAQHYQSPPQYPMPTAYYTDRRSSAATDYPISLPPSLPSASSAESHGHTSSSADGYSTAHTTPIDQTLTADVPPRPMLPPPPGMPPNALLMATGFKCDYPSCTALPFQTQYLLSSHKNVHSQDRPHYCPVPDCPRSEGGRGFKRKNEMIRHGLVHNSPGYICPFCPDKEHRYPRPDNLQR